MKKKNSIFYTEDEDNCIELKTVLGIKPGIYLTVYYSLIIVLVLFLVLVYPGIRNYGSRISFSGGQDDISVWIDGIYAGATPCTVYTDKGKHTVSYKKAGFKEIKEEIDVKGHFFATLFKKPELEINKNLELDSLEKYLKWNLNEFNYWSSIGSFYPSYQPEKILSQSMKNLPLSYHDNDIVENYLLKSYKNITDEYLFYDFLKSLYYFKSGSNKIPSASDYISTISYAAEKISANKKLFLYAAGIINDECKGEIFPEGKSDILFRSYEKMLVKNGLLPSPYSEKKVGGRKYIKIPSGRYLFGNGEKDLVPSIIEPDYAIPHNIYIENFFISANEVTNEEYAAFINENSKWDKKNIDNLINEGLVNEDYLKDWTSKGPVSDEKHFSVRFISYYAAEAYCRWMSSKLDSSYNGMKIALPDEYQWEAAAIFSEKHGQLLLDIKGSLWEWCSNWFYPGDFITPSTETGIDLVADNIVMPENIFKSLEKSVRGGSWVNSSVDSSTRASQPPQWCTPFLGFRPVLVRTGNVGK